MARRILEKFADYILFGGHWESFAGANILYILPTNVYYGSRVFLDSNKKIRDNLSKDHSVLFLNSFFMFFSLFVVIPAKTFTYGVLGPIGTIRIASAYYKTITTGDNKYVGAINTPMSSSTFDSKYIFPYIKDE
jgi:hypothetical protein